MISPCGGCDPHISSAIVCYLSFFLSGCSTLLYLYWLGNYREELRGEEDTDPLTGGGGGGGGGGGREEEVGTGLHQNQDEAIFSSISTSSLYDTEASNLACSSTDALIQQEDNPLGASLATSRPWRGEEEDEEREDGVKLEISDNPYLNGDTYRHNLLWALHGILTNFIEASLAALFYSGLFQNNLTKTLIWVSGFIANFLFGNVTYVLLLVYFTNKSKMRELKMRWSLECVFNVVKDLYYIWVGLDFLDYLVKSSNST